MSGASVAEKNGASDKNRPSIRQISVTLDHHFQRRRNHTTKTMRITTHLLAVSLLQTAMSNMTPPAQAAWYYHVKTGGMGGKPLPSEADPSPLSCWNSINAAFAAVKSRATPGPWIIQVDDEATYDEAVVLSGLKTSSIETLTLTKAPWLVGTPTIYPRGPFRSALALQGLWPGTGEGRLLGGMTYVTVRGFTLKNNVGGTDKTTELPLFTDNQNYMTEGLHIVEDCVFDGQKQVYDSRTPDMGVFENVRFFQDISRMANSRRSRDPGKTVTD